MSIWPDHKIDKKYNLGSRVSCLNRTINDENPFLYSIFMNCSTTLLLSIKQPSSELSSTLLKQEKESIWNYQGKYANIENTVSYFLLLGHFIQ